MLESIGYFFAFLNGKIVVSGKGKETYDTQAYHALACADGDAVVLLVSGLG